METMNVRRHPSPSFLERLLALHNVTSGVGDTGNLSHLAFCTRGRIGGDIMTELVVVTR